MTSLVICYVYSIENRATRYESLKYVACSAIILASKLDKVEGQIAPLSESSCLIYYYFVPIHA